MLVHTFYWEKDIFSLRIWVSHLVSASL